MKEHWLLGFSFWYILYLLSCAVQDHLRSGGSIHTRESPGTTVVIQVLYACLEATLT